MTCWNNAHFICAIWKWNAFRIRVCCMRCEKFSSPTIYFRNQCFNFDCSKNGHGLSFIHCGSVFLFITIFTTVSLLNNECVYTVKWVIITSKFNIFLFKSNPFVFNPIVISALFLSFFRIMDDCTKSGSVCIETKNFDLCAVEVLIV